MLWTRMPHHLTAHLMCIFYLHCNELTGTSLAGSTAGTPTNLLLHTMHTYMGVQVCSYQLTLTAHTPLNPGMESLLVLFVAVDTYFSHVLQ